MALQRINSPSADTPGAASTKINANYDELEKLVARLRYGLKVVVAANGIGYSVVRDGPAAFLGIGPNLYTITADVIGQSHPAGAGTYYVHALAGTPPTYTCTSSAAESTTDRVIARLVADSTNAITAIENWPDDSLAQGLFTSNRTISEFLATPTSSNTGDINTLLGRLATQLRRWFGSTHWYDGPPTTIVNLKGVTDNALRKDVAIPWAAAQDAGNRNLTNLADPVNPQDAVTKVYMEDLVADRIVTYSHAVSIPVTQNLTDPPDAGLVSISANFIPAPFYVSGKSQLLAVILRCRLAASTGVSFTITIKKNGSVLPGVSTLTLTGPNVQTFVDYNSSPHSLITGDVLTVDVTTKAVIGSGQNLAINPTVFFLMSQHPRAANDV